MKCMYYRIKDYTINNGDNFLQVHQTKISFFINGLEEDNTAFDARTLSGSITDFASSATQIGQSLSGKVLTSENYLFHYSITECVKK